MNALIAIRPRHAHLLSRPGGRAARRPSTATGRRGFTVLEVFVACVVLLAALTAALGMLGRLARVRRANEERQWAVEELENVLERLTTRSWNELKTERIDAESLAARARAVLPGCRMTFNIALEDGSPPGKRIDAELRWQSGSARTESHVQLATWVFPRERNAE